MGVSSFATGTFTPKDFAAALRAFGKDIDRPIVNAMRRGLNTARNLAIDRFRQRGVGRGIWGKDKVKGSVRFLVKRTRVVRKGNAFIGGLSTQGLPALQETGGRTKAHLIKPKNRKRLAIRTGLGPGKPIGGKGGLKHPGSRMKRIPFLADALRDSAPRIQAEMDAEIQKFAIARRVA